MRAEPPLPSVLINGNRKTQPDTRLRLKCRKLLHHRRVIELEVLGVPVVLGIVCTQFDDHNMRRKIDHCPMKKGRRLLTCDPYRYFPIAAEPNGSVGAEASDVTAPFAR